MKPTYIIVMNAGTKDAEYFNHEYYGTTMAYKKITELREDFPDDEFDVMKKLDNGTYTSEF